jgi:hypothetical protein
MPWNALLLALVGGFLFYRGFNGTRFIASRSDGQRLLLESSLYGTFLLLAGYIISRCVFAFLPGLYTWWSSSILYYPRIGPPLLALFLGFVSPFLLNLFVGERSVKESSYKRFSDFFGLLLYQAQCEDRHIAIDMKNRKVYVGLCIEFIPPGEHDKGGSILIQPVFSGYRDSTTHELVLTTDYSVATKSVLCKTDQAEKQLARLSEDFEPLSDCLDASHSIIDEREIVRAEALLEEAQEEEMQMFRNLQIALLCSEIIAVRFFDKGVFGNFASSGSRQGLGLLGS